MGIITVEKHIFYAEAVKYTSQSDADFSRTHLRVRTIRIPWGQGSARTIGYLDELQFGGTPEKVLISSVEVTKRFFLGMGFDHPKLIVADVGLSDLHTRQEIEQFFVAKYKQKITQKIYPERVVPNVAESIWDRLPDSDRVLFHRESSGSRVVKPSGQNKPSTAFHKFEYGPVVPGEVWLLIDPTYSGVRGVAYDTVVDLAKEYLNRPVEQTLFQKMDKKTKVFDTNGIIVLGVAYRLQYWRQRLPREPVQWLESVQRRVRGYLHGAIHSHHKVETPEPKFKTLDIWYAMGNFELPQKSKRTSPNYPTFRKGKGFVPAQETEKEALRPLFTVKARNREDAVQKAEEVIWLKINNPATAVTWGDVSHKWYAAGQLMVPRLGVTRFNLQR